MGARLRRARELCTRHLAFVGPGLVAAVAYVDPGNWATDLAAGARHGYKLLFIVFLAGLAAVVLQILSVRLGAVTSTSLPANTRALCLRLEARYPRYRRWFRAGLYVLWALAEIAIIATDLAELLGSAIALNLLFPKLPLFAGVLITAADVMIVLVFFRSNKGRQGMMLFEIVIVTLVLAVFVSFMILLHLIKPVWRDVFFGLVPSATLVKPDALYIGVGIIGATVMPHALFLGSHLATIDRLGMAPLAPERESRFFSATLPKLNPVRALRRHLGRRNTQDVTEIELDRLPEPVCSSAPSPASPAPNSAFSSRASLPLPSSKSDDKDDDKAFAAAQQRYEAEIRRFDRIRWVDLHVMHATVDTAYSLLGFALTINSAILTLAGAAFYYGNNDAGPDDADLHGAHSLISDYVGSAAGVIFALALLCAGQSASITATLAGQVVSEGFLEWKTSPMVRRLITRLIGVIPAAIVASAVGNKGLDTMLVASQVILSIVLPTVSIPLVYLCSQRNVMCVDGPVDEEPEQAVSLEAADPEVERSRSGSVCRRRSRSAAGTVTPEYDEAREAEDRDASEPNGSLARNGSIVSTASASPVENTEAQSARRKKFYTSPLWVTGLGYLLCGVVVLANGYVIVQLCLGNAV